MRNHRAADAHRRFRATYAVVANQERVFAIVDQDGGGRSITNDADAVIREIADRIVGKRLIYRDTDGRWDEICHLDGRFTGFKPVGADSLQAALCMVGGHV